MWTEASGKHVAFIIGWLTLLIAAFDASYPDVRETNAARDGFALGTLYRASALLAPDRFHEQRINHVARALARGLAAGNLRATLMAAP
ncbi:hypothetical protein [Bradyrhizobium sp. NP1]|uniref:hypothetical protein n=1 Tax=Bradyrhizobium sp. NP1 TaxID=3049772 RepID=UPI0025A5AB17|nr:hypothetical protein [Bradyrhizobium sp. NP1]WJR79909.1 hypothetical protein QOU61_09155 [Bradyrhizobium sp. NP1]